MSDSVARVYAQALAEVGQELGLLGRIYDDLKVVTAVAHDHPEVRPFFTSPRIAPDRKWEVLRTALEGQVCRPVLGLLKALVDNAREGILDNIARQFERYKDLIENRIHAHVTVAAPLDDAYRASLIERLRSASGGKDVDLQVTVRPEVLGGASIRVGDKIIDRTVRTRLEALRNQLLRVDD